MSLFSMDFYLSCAQVKCVCIQNSFAVCCFLISSDVGIQSAGNSQDFGPVSQSLELSTGFDLRPWKSLLNLSTRSKNMDL